MKTLGLPGVKPATKKWMLELFSASGENGHAFNIVEYRHWSENCDADINYEASCLKDISVDLVIAKSLGTIILTSAFNSYNFRPQKAVLIGSPIERHGSDNYALLYKFVTAVPSLLIQQTSDFNGSYRELNAVMQSYPNVSMVEVAGDDHLYSNIDELQNIIRPIYSTGD